MRNRDRRRPRRRGRVRHSAAVAAGAVLSLALALSLATSPAWAWWSDTATATSTVNAGVVPPATLSCGALSVLNTTFNWTAVAPPAGATTSYTLHYGSGTQAVTTTDLTYRVPNLAAANSAYVVVNFNFPSTTWTSANSNTRTYYVFVVGICN